MQIKNNKILNVVSSVLLSTTVALAFNANATESKGDSGVKSNAKFTLEKIMSDPLWIGKTPKNANWLPDSRHVVFKQANAGSIIDKTIRLDTLAPGSSKSSQVEVSLDSMHLADIRNVVHSDGYSAYLFQGDIFVTDHKTNKTTQLTYTTDRERSLQWMTNGELGYWINQRFLTIDLDTNVVKERVKLVMANEPKAPEAPKDIIAKEQHKLINYVANEHAKDIERFEYNQKLKSKNGAAKSAIFYFGEGQTLASAEVSPSGDKAFVAIGPKRKARNKTDVMPNYIGMDGRIDIQNVRRRVADAEPVQQQFYILDLNNGSKSTLSIEDIPDYDKDVLASVKRENAKAEGRAYQSKPQARFINIMRTRDAVQWHSSGRNVAIMLEAWDNKDRWLVTVDFAKNQFVTQHQLHDDAWINYTFNDFGWFANTQTLYFLSEQSGYSHLYTKAVNKKKVRQLTAGEYEVSNVALDSAGKTFFFRANINHPGEYHIYRLSSDANKENKPENLTEKLVGDNYYQLSPDEKKLLVTHSSLLRPDDLFLLDLESKFTTRLTDTVSPEFKAMPFKAPKIIEVPSKHTSKPIYARLYLPENYKEGEAKRAVIFNHGAGYLQNSHKGWSGYFREFMFHNLLTEQGYVVLDMDYRASKGYGRDWRTAIYRQMGTPETQDLVDGVDWLVENANVDRKRVGTYGGSYGGFMTFMALFNEPELFQAGAALRPVTDWAHYNDGYTSNILNRPSDDMIAYRRSSPIYFAEGLNKPLLINAPMIDDNVFFVDVVRLVQRLIELEKENFETAIYPVEPHGFRESSSWLDEYRRIYKLFEDNL